MFGAIADTPEPAITFYRHPGLSVWGTTDPDWAARNAHRGEPVAVEVPVVDFAATLAERGVPHYAKIDVEGADRLCLDALSPASRPALLSIESDKRSLRGVEDELDRLVRLGYTRFCAAQQQGMERRKLTTSARDGTTFTYAFEPHSSGPFGDDLPWSDAGTVLAQYARHLQALPALRRRLVARPLTRRPGAAPPAQPLRRVSRAGTTRTRADRLSPRRRGPLATGVAGASRGPLVAAGCADPVELERTRLVEHRQRRRVEQLGLGRPDHRAVALDHVQRVLEQAAVEADPVGQQPADDRARRSS